MGKNWPKNCPKEPRPCSLADQSVITSFKISILGNNDFAIRNFIGTTYRQCLCLKVEVNVYFMVGNICF